MLTRYSNYKKTDHNWKKYPNIKYAKYEEKDYVVRNYASEKINWLKNMVESF